MELVHVSVGPIQRIPTIDGAARRRPYWGLFGVAAAAFLLDAVTTFSLLDALPQVREQNPIAAAAFAAGPHVAATLKVLVVLQVAATAQVLRRLEAEWAGRLLFAAMAAIGAWGVGTAFGVLLASPA